MTLIRDYDRPGNVCETENLIERILAFALGKIFSTTSPLTMFMIKQARHVVHQTSELLPTFKKQRTDYISRILKHAD